MPYSPGVQSRAGELYAQGGAALGQGIAEGLKHYTQNKLMASQAVGKFEGVARANPELLQMLSQPATATDGQEAPKPVSPDVLKAFSKLQKEGAVGVRDAALLAQFADSYSSEKQQQAMQQARAAQAFAAVQRAQPKPTTVMPLTQVQQQYPNDKFDVNMAPVPDRPDHVEVKSISGRAPQNAEPKMVPTPAGVNVYDRDGKLQRIDPITQSAVPSGYRQTSDGKLEAIPGGPAEAEKNAQAEKQKANVLAQTTQLDVMLNAINDVLPKVGASTAGVGAMLSSLPGTPAYDMAAKLDTLKANIGFQQLAQMRAASPTGGALGQIAVKELDFLQAALGNLDKWQSPDQLKQTLGAIQTHLKRWQSAVQGQTPEEGAPAKANPADDILKKYGIGAKK